MSDSETVRMLARLAADAVMSVHFAFVIFVGVGGFLAWHWRRLVWLHAPVVVWAALIEFIGWTCPLTPLENHFREVAGLAAYEGSFIETHMLSLLYPVDYTMGLRVALGLLVVALNAIAYAVYFKGSWPTRRAAASRALAPASLSGGQRD